ncbi:MAG TPA: PD-(D/E)XK nuclease family protein [Tepidisphaeraceae bacterium]|nr:PD-(D/E)XK nuclease family protein [Tepidisphaeraceae bacterium]
MSVTFVIGRAGSGKTFRCFTAIVEAMRADPLGPPILWLLPKQATFTAQRRLTCDSGLEGFCRARVVNFEQLGELISSKCGGAAVPEVTPLGRQMILGHLLRKHSTQLTFFGSVARQVGLAGELDRTFAELERAGKGAEDIAALLDSLQHGSAPDTEGDSLAAKLRDLHLLYKAYSDYLGQDRLDQHRRLQQVLASVKSCSFLANSTIYVDEFYDFTDHERRMLGAIAKAGARMEITMLMDPHSPLLRDPNLRPEDMGLFHRTEAAYRRLWFTFADEGVEVNEPELLMPSAAPPGRSTAARPDTQPGTAVLQNARNSASGARNILGEPRFVSPSLAFLEREIFGDGDAPSPQSNRIQLLETPDRECEVDAVARGILALLQGGMRLRDIAVIVRDLERYNAIIAPSFEEHGIPYFADRRRIAAHHPLLQFLRSALQIARSDWPHDAVMALLKTGLAGLSFAQVDELENYCLLHRVRGGAGWESPQAWVWRRDLLRAGDDQASDDSPAASTDPPVIDTLRRQVAAGLSPLTALFRAGNPIAVREIAAEIFAVFDRFKITQTLARWMAAAANATAAGTARRIEQKDEHEQVWAELIGLFDQLVELLGDEPLSPGEFVEVLESGLESFDLALTPPTVDQVLVGQADRTRCPPVKAVFVLGLNEGEFPKSPRLETVLSDRDRREMSRRNLELDRDGRRQLLDERLLGYCAMTAASERLILCRPLGDDSGRETTPSIFWREVKRLFPTVSTRRLGRQGSGAGGVSQLATPRQVVAGLMRWVRAQNGATVQHDQEIRETPEPLHDKDRESWLALYDWLARRPSSEDAIGRLRQRAWPALAYANVASLAPDAGRALFSAPLSVTVGQLETFAACPFRHFARFGLRLAPRESPGVGAGDLGNLYHQLLERLVNDLIRAGTPTPADPLPISPEMIHQSAARIGKTLRGELMLSTARNRYLLTRVEQTLDQVIASQREAMKLGGYRPIRAGVAFGEGSLLPPLRLTTPGGAKVQVRGKIDRVDALPGAGDAAVFDYRLSVEPLSIQRVYHGLSLQLLTYLLLLQGAGEELAGRPLTPTAAFYLQLLRSFGDVKHPDEALDPSDPRYLLAHKPRGVFHARALPDLDSGCGEGFSMAVAAYIKKDGTFGHRERSDVAEADEFLALMEHTRRAIGAIADQIISGKIDVAPYRLNRVSPCPGCEYRGVCRFETSVNSYHHLASMDRGQVLEKLGQEARDEK